jgi:DNA-binding MarR family transcriptional regulator
VSERGQSDEVEQLRRTMQRLFRRFGVTAADTTPCGKPLSLAHAHALMSLQVHAEVSQQELGRELCIDKSNVARLCAKMEQAGHVRQRTSEHDARSRRVGLTPQGRRLAAEVDQASRERFATLLTALEPEQRPRVLAALQQLLQAMDGLPQQATHDD